MIGIYMTHPQVGVDPMVPVPRWSLSDEGKARLVSIRDRAWLRMVPRIVSSDETKAIETATVIAEATGASVEVKPEMGENDRSSTGFLRPDLFEQAADRFFGEPDKSWNGWERAVDASERIGGAVDRILTGNDGSAILFVGHGAVGTLLNCRLSGRPISRREDQPAGGGNIFAFRLADRALLCDWTSMESFDWSYDAD